MSFVRISTGQMIGVWEATIFCAKFINGGMVDVREEGRIFDVRILGGRGPSHKAGVALLARKGKQLYVANMFERSSIGMQGDYEFFADVVLQGGPSNQITISNDYGSTTVEDLDSAWHEAEKAALRQNACKSGENLSACIRRVRP